MTRSKENGPFIGPRHFERNSNDQRLFFGRDDETDKIISLIYAHNLVLVYAQSGAGKTSIFNAEVIPNLEENGFQVLPVARVKTALNFSENSNSQSNITSSDISNIYVFNSLQSLDPKSDPKNFLKKTFSQFITETYPPKKDEGGNQTPQVIIFDQFEELFNVVVDDRWFEHQKNFFDQINTALNDNRALRIVFVIREDHVAKLDTFKDLLPEKLRPRLRLERLTDESALSAIEEPLKLYGIKIENIKDEIEDIINDLLKITVETFGKGPRQRMAIEVKGNYVEPIHLQVVCLRWWNQGLKAKEYDNKEILGFTDVDKALEDFYENVVKEAVKETKVTEGDVRKWCENKLITKSGIRSIVYQSEKDTEGLSNNVVTILDKKYLIRPELRSNAVWYELAHDRLIRPIRESNKTWNNEERKKKFRRIKVFSFIAIAIVSLVLVSFYEDIVLLVTPIPEPGSQTIITTINNETKINLKTVEGSEDRNYTYFIISSPSNGQLSPVARNIYNYTPEHRFTGYDSFTFIVSNGKKNSSTVGFIDIVIKNLPLNPINQSIVSEKDAPIKISLVDLDYKKFEQLQSEHSIPFEILPPLKPSNGSIVLEAQSGKAIYLPHKGFTGEDSFGFCVANKTNTDIETSQKSNRLFEIMRDYYGINCIKLGIVNIAISERPAYFGYLTIVNGLTQGTVYPIHSTSVTIGRTTYSDIPDISIVDTNLDRSVSRLQARILIDTDKKFFLEDLGSSFKTIKGNTILDTKEKVELKNGDIFKVGSTIINFTRNINLDRGT